MSKRIRIYSMSRDPSSFMQQTAIGDLHCVLPGSRVPCFVLGWRFPLFKGRILVTQKRRDSREPRHIRLPVRCFTKHQSLPGAPGVRVYECICFAKTSFKRLRSSLTQLSRKPLFNFDACLILERLKMTVNNERAVSSSSSSSARE